jgi:Protein of unknown function (DUF2934)
MIDPQAHKHPLSATPVSPKASTAKMPAALAAVPSRDMIRQRAYQLYESRGREPGHADQDWFRAERELAKQAR